METIRLDTISPGIYCLSMWYENPTNESHSVFFEIRDRSQREHSDCSSTKEIRNSSNFNKTATITNGIIKNKKKYDEQYPVYGMWCEYCCKLGDINIRGINVETDSNRTLCDGCLTFVHCECKDKYHALVRKCIPNIDQNDVLLNTCFKCSDLGRLIHKNIDTTNVELMQELAQLIENYIITLSYFQESSRVQTIKTSLQYDDYSCYSTNYLQQCCKESGIYTTTKFVSVVSTSLLFCLVVLELV